MLLLYVSRKLKWNQQDKGTGRDERHNFCKLLGQVLLVPSFMATAGFYEILWRKIWGLNLPLPGLRGINIGNPMLHRIIFIKIYLMIWYILPQWQLKFSEKAKAVAPYCIVFWLNSAKNIRKRKHRTNEMKFLVKND